MKRKILYLLIIIFFMTGCLNLDPYQDKASAEKAIDAWFYYRENDQDLGIARRNLENIKDIVAKECNYLENDDNKNYIFSCKVTYKPVGETVIPLAQDETIKVYVALTFHEDDTFDYIVYHSSSSDKVWLLDEKLGYGKK